MERRKFIKLCGLGPLALGLSRVFQSNSMPDLDSSESLFYFTYENPVNGYNYARELANSVRSKNPEAKVMVSSGRAYMSDFLNNLRHDTVGQFREKIWHQFDFIVLNDADAFKMGSATVAEFRDLCFHFHDQGKKLIVNLPKSELDSDARKILSGFREISMNA